LDVPVIVVEAGDRVGGRVRTDRVHGFLLDRGFQVFLTAYPEAASLLDYTALGLKPFYPGALIQIGDRRFRFADPGKRPIAGLNGLLAPIVTLPDVLRLARMRMAIRFSRPHDAVSSVDRGNDGERQTTLQYLRQFGLSDRVVERFFRPFFGGVFLERPLDTPASFFRFVFSMFAQGPATLPSYGMAAIPEQLADMLPRDTVRLNAPVATVERHGVQLASGEFLPARAVVVATDADAARKLVPPVPPVCWNSTTTIYFTASDSPIRENILVLNGNADGCVNHVCVPSDVAPGYAPTGSALISVSVIGVPDLDDADVITRVIDELRGWFGDAVTGWDPLRIDRVRQALPVSCPQPTESTPPHVHHGVFVCGDHLQDPSINGAMASGRKTAAAVLASLSETR
jgi:phytoene dehydrogenase-like protein